jgi:hypothetical protein
VYYTFKSCTQADVLILKPAAVEITVVQQLNYLSLNPGFESSLPSTVGKNDRKQVLISNKYIIWG